MIQVHSQFEPQKYTDSKWLNYVFTALAGCACFSFNPSEENKQVNRICKEASKLFEKRQFGWVLFGTLTFGFFIVTMTWALIQMMTSQALTLSLVNVLALISTFVFFGHRLAMYKMEQRTIKKLEEKLESWNTTELKVTLEQIESRKIILSFGPRV